jgi:hypothetical protein
LSKRKGNKLSTKVGAIVNVAWVKAKMVGVLKGFVGGLNTLRELYPFGGRYNTYPVVVKYAFCSTWW